MTDNPKYKMLYECEIHGRVKALVIQILNDKINGTLTLSICCPICFNAKKKENEKR